MVTPEDTSSTFLVGGAVRDRLLNLPIKDRDWVVVGSSPEKMSEAGFRPVGKDFPVFLHPKTHEEYALARTERKTSLGYQGFSFSTAPDITLEEDLQRRDFTINAMAESKNGEIIDPYGGQRDLKLKVIRHVSDAFAEDPVRILRAARFAARFNFSIADETLTLMEQMVHNGEADALVVERVWQETELALGTASPQTFFAVLRESKALGVIFPEIDTLFGIPQNKKWHPEIDTGIHTLMVLEQAALLSERLDVRYAALTHDLGKALTAKHEWPSHKGHEQKGLALVERLADRLRVPKRFKKLSRVVCEYHLHTHRALELKPSTVLKLLEACDAFRNPEEWQGFLMACEADARGRTGLEKIDYPNADFLNNLYEAAKSVDGGAIAKQLRNGTEIAEAIRIARTNAIKEAQGKHST
ncbi:MAG TPA: multifunctional CCA addition/repair protein [Gammaproteobacteria bacterium]|jgi:tRNA nucleotidyltransferase (CCA-adding enzyme)|nr:multifunctional CCA addition/repair protein [Gammaproteobacteria bacterium]